MGDVLVIAEAGVNHNGDLSIAAKMVSAAAESGADAIKFQTFRADALVLRGAEKAEYQKGSTVAEETQREMISRLELGEAAHKELAARCGENGIEFMSSAFDVESLNMLMDLGVGTIKVPSGEITNVPYLRRVAGLGKKIIMLTGMARMDEVERALHILCEAGSSLDDITVLHCNTEYPTPVEDVNLLAMCTIRDIFGVKVGFSDHTLGTIISLAAVALGAIVIEKHFTLDREMEGPDHKASLEPAELAAMIRDIRQVSNALGNGRKKPSPSELKNRSVVRKSIVASRNIREGDVFNEDNLTAKRPETGISVARWDEVVGKRASRDFSADEMIEI